MMNTLTVIVILFFLIFMIIGYRRGLVKTVVKIVMAGLSLMLAYLLTPFVSGFLIDYTNIDDYFHDKIYSRIKVAVEDRIKEELSSVVDAGNAVAVDELVDAAMQTELTKNQQIDMICRMKVPEFVKDALIENNHDEMRDSMNANGFYDYVSLYIADMITKAISFAVTFVVIGLIFLVIYAVISIAVELPIINGINRLGGLAAGVFEALIIVWLCFDVAAIFSGTETGMAVNGQIEESPLLTFINSRNVFVSFLSRLIKIG